MDDNKVIVKDIKLRRDPFGYPRYATADIVLNGQEASINVEGRLNEPTISTSIPKVFPNIDIEEVDLSELTSKFKDAQREYLRLEAEKHKQEGAEFYEHVKQELFDGANEYNAYGVTVTIMPKDEYLDTMGRGERWKYPYLTVSYGTKTSRVVVERAPSRNRLPYVFKVREPLNSNMRTYASLRSLCRSYAEMHNRANKEREYQEQQKENLVGKLERIKERIESELGDLGVRFTYYLDDNRGRPFAHTSIEVGNKRFDVSVSGIRGEEYSIKNLHDLSEDQFKDIIRVVASQ